MFGTLDDFDELLARGARARHEARDGPRRQPHLRRAPVVRRVALEPRQPEARLVLVAAATGRADRTGARSSPARRGSSTRRPASTTCTCSRASSPTSTGRTPRSAQAIYAMMRWWLDRGVDGFRMDVINMISKDPSLPDAPGAATARRYYVCGPRIHEFLQEMHREVFAGRDGLLTVGEMPGVTRRGRQAVHRPGARRGRHGVPVRARAARPGRPKWDVRPLRLRDLKALVRPLAGRAGRASAGTACTGTTTTSRGSSRASATTRAPGARGQDARRPCCTCTAARRTSTRARSSG